MSERCSGSVRCNIEDLQEALSIHTRKITDSCRDKDCIEDLRVYLTKTSQNILDSCASAKVRCAELLYTYIDVEPVTFDGHHYCVNATFFYRILAVLVRIVKLKDDSVRQIFVANNRSIDSKVYRGFRRYYKYLYGPFRS